jgi:hypothetical protein
METLMNSIGHNSGLPQARADLLYAQVFNVKSFGAKGDGVTNDIDAFQSALNAAEFDWTAGKRPAKTLVFAPPGRYRFQNSGSGRASIKIPAGVTLAGSYQAPMSHGFEIQPQPPITDGTTFLIEADQGFPGNAAFCQLNFNSCVRGISFQWPNQQPSFTSPLQYPFAIGRASTTTGATNATIENVELLNPYQGIDATYLGRHTIRNVIGQPLYIGIFVDSVGDVGRIENVHFAPIWSEFSQDQFGNASPPIWKWQFENGTAYYFKRTDGQMVSNCFAYGYNVGVRAQGFPTFPFGPWIQFESLSLDTCRTGVLIEAAEPVAGLQFSNCLISGELTGAKTNPDGAAVVITGAFTSHVRFTNCAFRAFSPAVWIKAPSGSEFGNVLLSACAFNDKGPSSTSYSVTAQGGRVAVTGCQFLKASQHVQLASTVHRAIVLGNMGSGAGLDVFNSMTGGFVISDNI